MQFARLFFLFALCVITLVMKVILADVLGYCMGVRRAVECAGKALTENCGKKVYSLGPLIHNRIALENFAEKGLSILKSEDISSVENGSLVVIRAHGVPPFVLDELKGAGVEIIDATCPKVLASQKNAKKYAELGYTVILAGDANHGEVAGIAGYAGKKFILVQGKDEAENLPPLDDDENAVLLCQTTFSKIEFEQIVECLSGKIKNLKVLNTICSATKERQDALQELCPKVQGILVVGGKNSANTKRLFQIAKENCNVAALIETADEIPEQFFLLDSVGITAGASTPNSVIEEVEDVLKNRAKKN